MPSTVRQIVEGVGLEVDAICQWDESISADYMGVYVVAFADDPDDLLTRPDVEFSREVLRQWLHRVPALRVDEEPASVDSLSQRLSEFWLPDETILYIGQTSVSLTRRLRQYVRHNIGDTAPHAGGQWIKVLEHLPHLNIFAVPSEDPRVDECRMLESFTEDVSTLSKEQLRDPLRPYPFANLTGPLERKNTGIRRG